MDYNYHTHTYRCFHAKGAIEEYILRAIESGITEMGFSDHIPFRCPDGFEAVNPRVAIAEADAYVAEIRALREKHKEKIRILIGFESEYYPKEFPQMLANAKRWGAEYLILGQHYTAPEHPDGRHTSMTKQNENELKRYVETTIEGMETGCFTYVAHPDVINYTGDMSLYKQEMRKICVASKRLEIPLEINFYGIRDHRHYPNMTFWEIAGEEQAPVTFGFDAHDVPSAYDGESLKTALQMVERYGLYYIGRPTIINI